MLGSIFFAYEKTVENLTDYSENSILMEIDIKVYRDLNWEISHETETMYSKNKGNSNSCSVDTN